MDLQRISNAGHLLAVMAMVILVFRNSILGVGYAAILVQVFAAFLMLWARITFGRRSFHATADPTEGGLVISGPYHYLRHPIYAALLYFLWAGISSHISWLNVLLGLVATLGLVIRMFAEENLVIERYPGYAGYASRTKRIIPFVL